MTLQRNSASEYYHMSLDHTALQITTIVCMFIGLLSIYLWSKAFGGIFDLIKVGNAVRGGWSTAVNELAFFKHPSRLILISSFASLLLIKYSHKKTLNKVIFIISFIYSILFLLANDGRGSFALYFIVLAFIILGVFEKRNFSFKKMLLLFLLAILGFILIMNLDAITRFVRTGVYENTYNRSFLSAILKEFAHIMISGQTALRHAFSGTFLIVDDILYGAMAWIPSSLKPFEAVNIWNYNTALAASGFNGQYPCDIVSTSLYDLSIAGPIVFGLFWGSVLRRIEQLRVGGTVFHLVCYYSFFLTCIQLVQSCMLYSFVLSIFALTIFAIVNFCVKRILTLLNYVRPRRRIYHVGTYMAHADE